MIIVTGGAGFIGSNLLAGLEEKGDTDIVVCDTFGDGDKWRNVCKREIRDIIHPANLLDYMERHKTDIEMVFHFGGVSSTTESDADLVIQQNFGMSNWIWKWCAVNDVRLLYISSFATYGDGSTGFKDDESSAALAKLQPISPFGWSKHLFDRRIARIKAEGKEKMPPQCVGLKLFNVYGPNEYHKGDQMSVACKLFPQVEAGAAVRLYKSTSPNYKDGEQKRDFIYVRDVVDVILWFLENKTISGLYNLGSGTARTFNDLGQAMFEAVGKTPKFTYIDMPDQLRTRYQHFTEADMGKLRAAGYDKPFTSLEEGVKDYVTRYLRSSDRYR